MVATTVRRAVPLLACALALALLPGFAQAAPGVLDGSFGNGGSVVVEGPAGPQLHTQAPAKMALGADGSIYVLFANQAPCATFSGCTVDWSVARFSADGVRDTAFGAGPGSTLAVRGNEYAPADLAIGPDGRPVVVALDESEVVLARFDQSGHLETVLNAGEASPLSGGASSPPVVAVQADGKVLVAAGNSEELHIVRYLASGGRDPGFGSGGETSITMGTGSRPAGLLLGAGGTISVATPQCCGGSPPYGEGVGFARFLSDGHPDAALNGSGQTLLATPGARGNVEAVALAPDGGVYIVFEIGTETVSTVGNLVKLRPDGSVDTGFSKDGFSRFPMSVDHLAVDAKGRLLASGWDGNAAVFRMKASGGPDRSFGAGMPVPLRDSGPATTVALQGKGQIVALGEPCCGSGKTFTLFRLLGGTDHTRCLHRKATIVGTNGPDEIIGTPHRDVIAALGGRDKVRALGGPDVVCGGKGKDELFGGAGRNEVRP